MKNLYLFITILFLAGSSFSFGQVAGESNVIKKQGTYLGLSKPLRDMPQIHDESSMVYYNDEAKVRKNRVRPVYMDSTALPKKYDPLVQNFVTKASGSAEKSRGEVNLIQNFNGMNGAFPPDPSGAVSEDYYVQAVNVAYRVYNLDGTPATGIIQLKDLWLGSTNSGDPIVLWDRHAERFFVTQFQTGSNEILIAVSETSDPTGAYYTYSFQFNDFPDYPKYSVWSDGYYMTSNTQGDDIVAFERDKMLVGDATASMIALDIPVFASQYGFKSVLPADADGDLPPYGTPISMFLFQDDSWSASVTEDHIKVLKMNVDWITPSNTTIVIDQEISTAPFNSTFTNSWDDIKQKGTNQKLDAIASIFNYRAQYLKWPTYNTVLLCNVVDIDNTNTAGIRWYELRQDTDNDDWAIYQQGTYSIADGNSRFLGSISMDYNGHIGMGYSVSGPTEFPGLAATGRFAGDELGKFTFTETWAKKGVTFQSQANRYGDYSHMSLSPNGQEFWYTGEYIGSGGSRKTRIFSFNLQSQVGVKDESMDNDPTLILMQNDESILIEGSYLPNSKEMYIDLFDISGKLIERQTKETIEGKMSASFDKTGLSNGVYLVRIGKESFMRVEKIVVSK
ncbi:T9SS type A sorting domain-containing protein [Brumimicrobium glaciale]|uniref:T9SS type A sorting domain-containing protein n=1 Tax=Brumimicrobium glaciale TaxID=200475 RepID=A0A4V1WFF2_9FLAO|nr:T9SS type A sorting domain-containing protein [Brumimicrobium glaciale]RYM32986.1 T9SS type A sorting domain-containing protein [Brumimicrobium glaciale]